MRLTIQTLLLFLGILLLAGCSNNESAASTKYYWDDDGMLVLENKRTFIIGSYHLPKVDNPYQNLAENGYNYVRVDASQEALDAAQQYNLKTWITTGCISEDKQDEDRKRITGLVNKLKTHPALLCWEITDEPAWMWNSAERRIKPELMIETYLLIKQKDTEHLVYTNHAPTNLVSTMQKYNDATDIVACDIYPVIPYGIKPTYALFPDGLQGDLLNPYLSQVGEYADKMHRVTNNSKPLFMVLQGFAWEIFKKVNKRDTAMIQYPTFGESRFMAYNAIVHGAVGINYFGMSYMSQPCSFMDDLNRLTRELAEMQNILTARTIELDIKKTYHEIGYSVDTGVEIIAKQVNGMTYLITVNSDKNPVKISLKGHKEYGIAMVLYENRKIEISNSVLTDEYEPFDVHIYELR